MPKSIYIAPFLLLAAFLFSSCTKEVPKDLQNTQKQQTEQKQMPNDPIHKLLEPDKKNTGDTSKTSGDPKADALIKEADNADAEYQKTKSDDAKQTCIAKQLAAANYLMFDANLSPKKKYRPALQRYRRILELDPENKEALKNKKELEDIYKSMGMPIPD